MPLSSSTTRHTVAERATALTPRTGSGGVSCVTRPGVVFCNANGGGEFICGTFGTTIGGGGAQAARSETGSPADC
jgi:hypothetical protein